MCESWDTLGELGHDHGEWVKAQLSHIGRVGPLCGRVGTFNVLSMPIVIRMFINKWFLFIRVLCLV